MLRRKRRTRWELLDVQNILLKYKWFKIIINLITQIVIQRRLLLYENLVIIFAISKCEFYNFEKENIKYAHINHVVLFIYFFNTNILMYRTFMN